MKLADFEYLVSKVGNFIQPGDIQLAFKNMDT